MDAKTCFKCNRTQPMSEFYAHKQMADGTLGKCKTCTKIDVKARYYSRPDLISAYERRRFKDPERKKKVAQYQRNSRAADPQKAKARSAVSNAVRDGRIVRPSKCSHCGVACRAQAHHHDYSKPFEVTWYCFKCHREIGHGQRVMC
jgi:hypothetical protein